jgi:hypothetical protein
LIGKFDSGNKIVTKSFSEKTKAPISLETITEGSLISKFEKSSVVYSKNMLNVDKKQNVS